MATVNEVTLMENREGDLRQNFRHLLFLWKPTGLVKLFTPASSQRKKKYKSVLRPHPLARVYSVQILLELHFVGKREDILLLSQNVQWADIMSSEHIIVRRLCGSNIFTNSTNRKCIVISVILQCYPRSNCPSVFYAPLNCVFSMEIQNAFGTPPEYSVPWGFSFICLLEIMGGETSEQRLEKHRLGVQST